MEWIDEEEDMHEDAHEGFLISDEFYSNYPDIRFPETKRKNGYVLTMT